MKKWHTKIWGIKYKSDEWMAAMAGITDPGEFTGGIFKNDDYAALFVYMVRRFGYPATGSDDYKEIACWFLTTPDPNIALIVSPRPNGMRYSFGYTIRRGVYNTW